MTDFILLSRYIHILMVFWSFLAGVATFYCSIGPETLLPNMFFTFRPRNSVSLVVSVRRVCVCGRFIVEDCFSSFSFFAQRQEQELFPLGNCCAVCGKVKCKRHR